MDVSLAAPMVVVLFRRELAAVARWLGSELAATHRYRLYLRVAEPRLPEVLNTEEMLALRQPGATPPGLAAKPDRSTNSDEPPADRQARLFIVEDDEAARGRRVPPPLPWIRTLRA